MTGARRAAWAVGTLASVVAIVAAVVLANSGDDGAATDPAQPAAGASGVVRDLREAAAPFTGMTYGSIDVGDRRLDVVLADDEPERVTGLRERRDAAPYDGMLFVFSSDTTTSFTMATVRAPLDIAFFGADGRRVDALRMEPCAGTDATCPAYRSSGAFRYALETAVGALPPGNLQVRHDMDRDVPVTRGS